MFEPSSAMTLIAEDGEFRFARFYIVCEAVPLGTLGNPLIVCGLSDTFRGVSKRGRDTESDAKIRQEEMLTFFSNECSICIPSEIEGHGLFRILLLSSKGDCLLQVGSPFFFALFYDRRKKESYFFGQVIELDIAGKGAWLWRSSKYSRCI